MYELWAEERDGTFVLVVMRLSSEYSEADLRYVARWLKQMGSEVHPH
jgi:hypothetical protein